MRIGRRPVVSGGAGALASRRSTAPKEALFDLRLERRRLVDLLDPYGWPLAYADAAIPSEQLNPVRGRPQLSDEPKIARPGEHLADDPPAVWQIPVEPRLFGIVDDEVRVSGDQMASRPKRAPRSCAPRRRARRCRPCSTEPRCTRSGRIARESDRVRGRAGGNERCPLPFTRSCARSRATREMSAATSESTREASRTVK